MKTIIKNTVKVLYKEILLPMAKDYVNSTENTWDDKALLFLDDLVNELLNKL